jgi:hypothetical protein
MKTLPLNDGSVSIRLEAIDHHLLNVHGVKIEGRALPLVLMRSASKGLFQIRSEIDKLIGTT